MSRTPEQLSHAKAMAELYRQGFSLQEVGKRLGVSGAWVRQTLRKNKIERRSPGRQLGSPDRRSKVPATKNESGRKVPVIRDGSVCYVYVISTDIGFVKIGITINLNKRLGALQVGSPVPLHLFNAIQVRPCDAEYIEEWCHQELQEYRRHGEWFEIDEKAAWECVLRGKKKFHPDVAGSGDPLLERLKMYA